MFDYWTAVNVVVDIDFDTWSIVGYLNIQHFVLFDFKILYLAS